MGKWNDRKMKGTAWLLAVLWALTAVAGCAFAEAGEEEPFSLWNADAPAPNALVEYVEADAGASEGTALDAIRSTNWRGSISMGPTARNWMKPRDDSYNLGWICGECCVIIMVSQLERRE